MTTEEDVTPTANLIEAVRQTCIEAALAAYEMARVDGLCHEGAWECAVDAMRTVDLDSYTSSSSKPDDRRDPP